MTTFYMWGCSDDLIEITGDVSEEYSGEGGTLITSNGITIDIYYTVSGNWVISHVNKPAHVETHVEVFEHGSKEAIEFSEGRDYSDVVRITVVDEEVTWFAFTQGVTYL